MAQKSTSETGEKSSDNEKDTSDYDQLCAEILLKLLRDEKAKRADFPIASKNRTIWSYAHRAIFATLKSVRWNVSTRQCGDRETEICLNKTGSSYEPRYDTGQFKTNERFEEKRKIGQLVALYLAARPRRVLLGSGSTLYWVGRALAELPASVACRMAEVLTVNIALASYWCEFGSPFDAISVLDGLLDTKRFRYRRMGPAAFPMPVVVIGADGCFFDRASGKASLFGVYSDVSSNTDHFIANAQDTLICCLTHDKLGDEERQNCGEEFKEPQEFVQKILVTDKQPQSKRKAEALTNGGWKIVTDLEGWNQIEEGKDILKIVDELKELEVGWVENLINQE